MSTRDDYDDGVINWLRLVLSAQTKADPKLQLLIMSPNAQHASEAYLSYRYLEFLSTKALFQRFRDLYGCTLYINDEGKIDFSPWNEWNEALVHTATELALRNEGLDARTHIDLSWVNSPTVALAVTARSRRKLEWTEWNLVKYGPSKFMRAFFERGAIRISPASYYDDPSLDSARKDDEIQRPIVRDTWTSDLLTVGVEIPAEEIEKMNLISPVRSAVDYYIYSMAGGFQIRLFHSFGADSCVVITDVRRFLTDLRAAVAEQLPKWHYGNFPVRYIDPFELVRQRKQLSDIDRTKYAPWFCKHFSYAYQQEIRIAWLPPEPRLDKSLDHVFVELGPLDDYCEFVEL